MAVIIETSAVPNLVPLILHFASVLGPSWTVVLYTMEETWKMEGRTMAAPSFRRAIEAGRVETRYLPKETSLDSVENVSKFLTKPWIWEQLQSAQRVLFFQPDSIICSESSVTVEDFSSYDFIGAPIDPFYGTGFNGGLSLRNPKLFLEITQESDFENSKTAFEDQWFYQELRAREGRSNSTVVLPSPEVAQLFAVESMYYKQPLGYHQPSRWQADKMGSIEAWCPEVKMTMGRRLL